MEVRWQFLACVVSIGCSSERTPATESTVTYERCTPRYGASTGRSGFFRVEDLPSGSCTGTTTCDMAAEKVCGCPTVQGPVGTFRCTCTSNEWKCTVVTQGAGICPLECADAG